LEQFYKTTQQSLQGIDCAKKNIRKFIPMINRTCIQLATFILLFCQAIQAQQLIIDWEVKPIVHTISNKDFLKESAIVVLEHNQYEVTNAKNNSFQFTHRTHKIIRVNDEKGIESFNKVRIRFSDIYPISSIKARSISPLGIVNELKIESFKEVSNDEGGMEKIFALEGVERGSEIEYVYEQNRHFIPFGTEYLQDVIPVIENKFEIITPENLIFDLKGYNNVNVGKIVTKNEKNSWLVSTENLKGLSEEKYASYVNHFARIEYAIAFNKKVKEERIYDWDMLFRDIYLGYVRFSDNDFKACNKVLEAQKDYMNLTDIKDKIAWIENFLKSTYVQQDYVADENAEQIGYILKNKITNEDGFKNLFTCMFLSQKISFDIGYTTDRFMKKFDADFVNADNLQHFILYFPGIRQYLAPAEMYYRTPLIPSQWCGQNGLFSRTSLEGGKLKVIAETRIIPEESVESNFHNHDVSVRFNEDIDTAQISMKQTFGGHNSLQIMPVFVLLENEKRTEASKQILAINQKDEPMDGFKFENNAFSNISTRKPLSIQSEIHSSSFIEKAGNKYLLNVGQLIGQQSEMYQEKERQFDMEIPNPHQYARKLSIEIPTGFKLSNLDKLNMNIFANVNGKESCKFVSSYSLNEKNLQVDVFEIYRNSFTPLSEYEPYRKVINAAADFNKIVVVMEKK
jgi:hypothetical protein